MAQPPLLREGGEWPRPNVIPDLDSSAFAKEGYTVYARLNCYSENDTRLRP